MRIHADLEACQGYVVCAMQAPELFDIDDDEGKVKVRQPYPGQHLQASAQAAVRACPAGALSLIPQ